MSLGLPYMTFAYSMCLIVECLYTQLMSHGPGPRLIGHAFYDTERGDIGEREGEPSGGGHRVKGLCEGRSGVGGREGRGTVEGHGGEGRRREQGATSRHHAPSRHCPCEGSIVHWKQEDKELGLSLGSLEKEEVPSGSLERSPVTQ